MEKILGYKSAPWFSRPAAPCPRYCNTVLLEKFVEHSARLEIYNFELNISLSSAHVSQRLIVMCVKFRKILYYVIKMFSDTLDSGDRVKRC